MASRRENLVLAIMVVSMSASIVGALFTTLIATNLHKKLQDKLGTCDGTLIGAKN